LRPVRTSSCGPDVRAQVVFSDDTRVLGLFTLNFGYRF